jgi:hypothetical protein
MDDHASDDAVSSTSSRKGFIRKLGTFAAVGVGVALVPNMASARLRPLTPDYCCPNSSCDSGCGGSGGFYCTGPYGNCCYCSSGTSCFYITAPC